jgi:hypothetical protein
LSTTVRWSWQYGPVLNPQEDVFSIRMYPLDPGEPMLSQKLNVSISIHRFHLLAASIHETCSYSVSISSFHLFTFVSGPRCHLAIIHIETIFFLLLRSLQIFILCCPTQSSERCFVGKRYPLQLRDLPPPTPIYAIAWAAAHWFLLVFPVTAPHTQLVVAAGLQQAGTSSL